MSHPISLLPLKFDLETRQVLKKLIDAKSALSKLDGISNLIPNKEILINTLSLQEAKNSSLLENIITTDEELYSSDSLQNQFNSVESKEVYRYTDALRVGYKSVKERQLLTNNDICKIQSILKESDGNGRTGRIINVLYLVKQNLLQTPILYLSRYINEHKSEYYRLLQTVRDDFSLSSWENWILYMLNGVEKTSLQGISLIENIKNLMQSHKDTMRNQGEKIYSQDFLNATFNYPYTTTDIVQRELDISRSTATSYLNKICDLGLADKIKLGRKNYYINNDLVRLLRKVNL